MDQSVTLVAAFAGGLVSFLSPCVLPIVPAYLSLITGLSVEELDEGRHLGTITRTTLLFIAGFTTVFVLLGLGATTVGSFFVDYQALLTRVSGLFLVAMALFLLGSLYLEAPWLYQERRYHPQLSRFGPFAAPVAGVAFGFGWTPCIGPVLTSVLAVAATQGEAARGATLLAVYSLGLGVPFLVMGLAFGRSAGASGWVKRHYRAITGVAAASLGLFGVVLALDHLTWVTVRLQDGMRSVGLDRLVELG